MTDLEKAAREYALIAADDQFPQDTCHYVDFIAGAEFEQKRTEKLVEVLESVGCYRSSENDSCECCAYNVKDATKAVREYRED